MIQPILIVTVNWPDDPDRGIETYGPFDTEQERETWVDECEEAATLGWGLLVGAHYHLYRMDHPFEPTSLMQDGARNPARI